MPDTNKEISIKVELNGTKAVVREANVVERSIKDVGDEGTNASEGLGSFQTGLAAVATGSAAAAAAIGIVLYKGTQMAEQAQETASKYRRTLGPAIDKTNQFIAEYATLMGLSNTEAKELLATNTNIGKSFGLTTEEAADLSIQLAKTAGDLSSYNNVPIKQTTNAITSALAGEREALKTLGIVINEEMVKQQAMTQFNLDSVDAITMEHEALATMTLIRQKAGIAIGDLMATRDSAANQRRRVQAQIKNLANDLSVRLLPAYGETLDAVGNIVDELQDWLGIELSDKLKEEQAQLNVLVGRITQLNKGSKQWNTLMGKLQKTYPGFLENMNAEEVNAKQLSTRLAEVNEQYRKKIRLQLRSEAAGEARSELKEDMAYLVDMRLKVLRVAERYNREREREIDITNKSTEAILNQIEAFEKTMGKYQPKTIVGQGDPTNNLRSQFQGAMKAVKAQRKEVEKRAKAFKQLKKQLPEMWGSMKKGTQTIREQINATKKALKKSKEQFAQAKKNTVAYRMYASSVEYYTDKLKKLQNQREQEQDGGGGPTNGGTITYDTQVNTAGLQNVSLATGGTANMQQIEAQARQRAIEKRQNQQRIAEKKQLIALQTDLSSLLVKTGKKHKSLAEIAIPNLKEQQKGLQMTQKEWGRLSSRIGMAAAQAVQYSDTTQEAIKGVISATINQIIAYLIQSAIQSALGSGPLALLVAPALIAGATALAKTVTSGLLDFERGGLMKAQNGMIARGPSHAEGGILAMLDGQPAYEIEGGEAVINKKSTEMFGAELSAINQAGGGVPLAEKGALTVNAPARSQQPVSANTSTNTASIAAAVREGMESARVVAVMKDSLEDFSQRLNDLEEYQQQIGNA